MSNEEENETPNVVFKTEEPVEVSESVPQEQFYRAKSFDVSSQKPSKIQLIKDFITECRRVLLLTKRPDAQELKTIIKISGLGILLIGLIGFLINLTKELLFK